MDATVEDWMAEEFEERWAAFAGCDTGDDAAAEAGEDDVSLGTDTDRPQELAVVERDLPGHLFGFTRRDASHVVVNRRLYKVDRERTVRHEKTHHLHPKDEMTIRYINGDPDVRHTLSFKGNNPARLGTGSRGRPARSAYGTTDAAAYGRDVSTTYI